MLSVKAKEAADTIFKVLGMTQPRIKLHLPFFIITNCRCLLQKANHSE